MNWATLSILSAAMWGLQFAIVGAKLKHLPPLLLATVYFIGCAVVFGLLSTCSKERLVVERPDYLPLAGTLFAGVIANYCIFSAVRDRSATLVSLIEVSTPVFVALFSWILFREHAISPRVLIGAALIMSGVMIVNSN